MRPIEFRGLDCKSGNWVYGYIKTIDHKYNTAIIIGEYLKHLQKSWIVELSSVGQYTGIKDKNGKKIFEGDIVKHRGYNGMRNSVVKFEAGAFIVGYHDGSSTKRRPMLLQDKVEIVGNIHERKEI